MTKPALALLLSASLLGACATSGTNMRNDESPDDVEGALMTPVQDVGLSKIKIPDMLKAIDNPYEPRPASCAALGQEVVLLNGALGEDLDVPEDEAARRERIAYSATGDAVSSVLIPFRGVVRAVSGASSRERKAREAYQRGLVRRGYLKGLAEDMDCTGLDLRAVMRPADKE